MSIKEKLKNLKQKYELDTYLNALRLEYTEQYKTDDEIELQQNTESQKYAKVIYDLMKQSFEDKNQNRYSNMKLIVDSYGTTAQSSQGYNSRGSKPILVRFINLPDDVKNVLDNMYQKYNQEQLEKERTLIYKLEHDEKI